MAKRILVPLDHTPPPHELLDLVHGAARGSGAVVRLMHVAPVPERLIGADGHIIAYADQEVARLEAEGLDRLHPVALHFFGCVPVESVIRFGDPVTEIIREADLFEADLIMLPTRGRTGMGRLLFGSVAEQVARRAHTAVALIRPQTVAV